MATGNRYLWASLLIAVVTISALGCASKTSAPASASAKVIGPYDIPRLAGKWTGTVVLPSGSSVPGTFELSPNGDYSTEAGAFNTRGRAEVKDGNLVLVSKWSAGAMATGQRASVASLHERQDGMLVLKGNGHSDTGPFSFDVARKK